MKTIEQTQTWGRQRGKTGGTVGKLGIRKIKGPAGHAQRTQASSHQLKQFPVAHTRRFSTCFSVPIFVPHTNRCGGAIPAVPTYDGGDGVAGRPRGWGWMSMNSSMVVEAGVGIFNDRFLFVAKKKAIPRCPSSYSPPPKPRSQSRLRPGRQQPRPGLQGEGFFLLAGRGGVLGGLLRV